MYNFQSNDLFFCHYCMLNEVVRIAVDCRAADVCIDSNNYENEPKDVDESSVHNSAPFICSIGPSGFKLELDECVDANKPLKVVETLTVTLEPEEFQSNSGLNRNALVCDTNVAALENQVYQQLNQEQVVEHVDKIKCAVACLICFLCVLGLLSLLFEVTRFFSSQ